MFRPLRVGPRQADRLVEIGKCPVPLLLFNPDMPARAVSLGILGVLGNLVIEVIEGLVQGQHAIDLDPAPDEPVLSRDIRVLAIDSMNVEDALAPAGDPSLSIQKRRARLGEHNLGSNRQGRPRSRRHGAIIRVDCAGQKRTQEDPDPAAQELKQPSGAHLGTMHHSVA